MPARLERRGPAAVLVLDWPEVRNALDMDSASELRALIAHAAQDTDISGLIVTGAGAFCAGANLKGVVGRSTMPPEERRKVVYEIFQGMIRDLIAFPLPTVAAIDGPAIGLGFDLALACDSRLLGPAGWLMQGWGRIGVIPGTGGEYLLRIRAPGLLWRLLDGQPRVDGPMAERCNLGEDSGTDSALDRALARIANYAQMPRPALQAYVDLYRMDLRRELDVHLEAAVERQVQLLRDPGLAGKVTTVLGKEDSGHA